VAGDCLSAAAHAPRSLAAVPRRASTEVRRSAGCGFRRIEVRHRARRRCRSIAACAPSPSRTSSRGVPNSRVSAYRIGTDHALKPWRGQHLCTRAARGGISTWVAAPDGWWWAAVARRDLPDNLQRLCGSLLSPLRTSLRGFSLPGEKPLGPFLGCQLRAQRPSVDSSVITQLLPEVESVGLEKLGTAIAAARLPGAPYPAPGCKFHPIGQSHRVFEKSPGWRSGHQ